MGQVTFSLGDRGEVCRMRHLFFLYVTFTKQFIKVLFILQASQYKEFLTQFMKLLFLFWDI